MRCFIAFVAAVLFATTPIRAGEPPRKIDFARDIRPILANHCWACHGQDEATREGGLRLDDRAAATGPLKNGRRAIVPGAPNDSHLVARIFADKPARRMPPPESNKPLSEVQKRLLKDWIAQGAEYTKHWAFVPPVRPALPPVVKGMAESWPRNPIDHFVLHRLTQEKLRPAPEASPETLLRRVTLDLTGLPPTPSELAAFLKECASGQPRDINAAYEKVVDQLLASPRYAERMAMSWLDAARFADTNGYNNDEERSMWPWRDWVIDAFRTNMPYNRFVVEQVAGDMLPGATLNQKIATGFNRNHVLTTEGGIVEDEYRVEYVADRVHTTATVFLGLSMQCCRCHDHKFDPLTMRDYYQFFAYFNQLPDRSVGYNKGSAAEPFVRVPTAEHRAKLRNLDDRRATAETLRQQRSDQADTLLANALKGLDAKRVVQLRRHYLDYFDPEYRRLKALVVYLDREKAELEKTFVAVMVMQDLTPPRPTHVLKRGQYDQPGDKVAPDVPSFLTPLPKGASANRLGLAQWLVQPEHPLTARVAVNRWWEMIFGTGLVETAEDFGLQGQLPSHPELLDWLATELVRTGWDTRAMLKLIVTSAMYRQSSRTTTEHLERDPRNRLLARSPRFRLPAEMVRDNALAISGLLKDKVGGPSVKPYQPDGLWEDVSVERRYKYLAATGDDLYRRSMYTYWRRTCAPPGMTTFDAPDRETCLIRRARTNTPLQALILMNDPTYVEAARKLAERMLQNGPSAEARIARGFQLAVSRLPSPSEREILTGIYDAALTRFRADKTAATRFLGVGASALPTNADAIELAAWTTVASALLNMDETITRP